MNILLRNMNYKDSKKISDCFKEQGWCKPVEQYEVYLKEQVQGKRDIIIALYNDSFAGYVTIVWESDYPPFKEKDIPEIKDLNVLIKYRNKGIASLMLEEAEQRIAKMSEYSGLGVGLLKDYGFAQRLYAKRGYIPDGKGIVYGVRFLDYGEETVVNDDLCLMMIKKVK